MLPHVTADSVPRELSSLLRISQMWVFIRASVTRVSLLFSRVEFNLDILNVRRVSSECHVILIHELFLNLWVHVKCQVSQSNSCLLLYILSWCWVFHISSSWECTEPVNVCSFSWKFLQPVMHRHYISQHLEPVNASTGELQCRERENKNQPQQHLYFRTDRVYFHPLLRVAPR